MTNGDVKGAQETFPLTEMQSMQLENMQLRYENLALRQERLEQEARKVQQDRAALDAEVSAFRQKLSEEHQVDPATLSFPKGAAVFTAKRLPPPAESAPEGG